MAQATLREMAREVVLMSGEVCPLMLAERFIRNRYRLVCEKNLWSFKIGQGYFSTLPSATGTCNINGNTVTAAGSTVLTIDEINKQINIAGNVFTITGYNSSGGGQWVLDGVWNFTPATNVAFSTTSAYITPTSTDFHAFYSVLDTTNGRRLNLLGSAIDLDKVDPRRDSKGTPYCLYGRMPNTFGLPMFELWPHPTTEALYPYMYEKRIADLSTGSSQPPAIIRSDMLVTGALADLARWPGTFEKKNPFYDPYFNQWKVREAEFKEQLNDAIREDQSRLLTDLSYRDYYNFNHHPDANYMQSHEF